MSDTCTVEDCDRPVEDAFCCSHCAWCFEQDLGSVPALAEELDIVLARQTRYLMQTEPTKGDPVTPLFYDPRISEIAYVLRNTLQTWVRLAWEERDYATNGYRPYPEQDTIGDMSNWLMWEVEWLRHHQAGHEAFEEVRFAIQEATRLIDRPDNRTTFPVGACPEADCEGEVRVFIPATEGKMATMSCRECGIKWDSDHFLFAGRRIVTAAADRIRPYVNTATAAVALGVTDRRVRQLCAAGTLTNHGTAGGILLDLDEIEALQTRREGEVPA